MFSFRPRTTRESQGGLFPFVPAAPIACDNLRMNNTAEHMYDDPRPLVVLGVTGCIAAYKSCEIVRALVKADVRVKVVMTEAATRFVGPVTFRTLSDEPVTTSLWDDPGSSAVHHVSLAEEADVMLIAPCTANVIAKLACGRADDILTTTALATQAPLIIAPAMNTHMWRNPATQENLLQLRSRGAVVVEPGVGELACGDTGEGRLADLDSILEQLRAELGRSRDLRGVKVLVTAGPTREPIDAVRFVSNASSGRQGYAVAEEAARRGAEVTLVSGPTYLPDPFGVRTIRVTTAQEMFDAATAAHATCDVVIATAAVSDFRPASAASGKIKKDVAPETLELARNPDILASLGHDKGTRILVGFAAETDDVVAHAKGKLDSKNLDLIVANDVSVEGLGFGSERNRVVFVDADGEREVPLSSKTAIARLLLDDVSRRLRRNDERNPDVVR